MAEQQQANGKLQQAGGEEPVRKPNLSLKKALESAQIDDPDFVFSGIMRRRRKALEYDKHDILDFFQKTMATMHPSLNEFVEPLPELVQTLPSFPVNDDECAILLDLGAAIILPQKTPGKFLRPAQRIIAPFSNCPWVNDNTQRLWWYIDEGSIIQGPFTSLEMDNWFHEGYFFNELLISYDSKTNFMRLVEFLQKFYSAPKKQMAHQSLIDLPHSKSTLLAEPSHLRPERQDQPKAQTPHPSKGLERPPHLIQSVMDDLKFSFGSKKLSVPKEVPAEQEVNQDEKDKLVHQQAHAVLREEETKPVAPAKAAPVPAATSQFSQREVIPVKVAPLVSSKAIETPIKTEEQAQKSAPVTTADTTKTVQLQATMAKPTETSQPPQQDQPIEKTEKKLEGSPSLSSENAKKKESGRAKNMHVVWVEKKSSTENLDNIAEDERKYGTNKDRDYDNEESDEQAHKTGKKKRPAGGRRANFKIEYEPKKA